MSEPKHKLPELEAIELEAVGWFVRTKRTNEDSAGWLIADCSTATHGREWATLFASSQKLRGASHMARDIIAMLDAEESIQVQRITEALEALDAALAAAEGRTEEKDG